MKKGLFCALFSFCVMFVQAQSNVFEQGKELFLQDDYLEALVCFQKAAADSTWKNQPEIYLWLARDYFILLDYSAALHSVDYILTNFPYNPEREEASYWQARIFYAQNNYEETIQLLSSFLQTYPNSYWTPHALFWMAEAAFALKNYDDAGLLYSRVIQDYSTSDKVVIAYHRLKIIELKQREEELIKLLRWSRNETLNTSEEFQNKEKAYQQSIQAYQEKILELTQSQSAEVKSCLAPEAKAPPAAPAEDETKQKPQPATNDGLVTELQRLREQILGLKKSYSKYLEWKDAHEE